jgi:hypothetical protein
LQTWLDRVFDKFLTNPDGTPKVKVHGFGLTTPDLLFRYPWYSVDSGTWWRVSRYGGSLLMDDLEMEDGSIQDSTVVFSDRQSHRRQHYRWLHLDDQRRVDRRLEQLEAERVKDPELEADFKAKFGCEMGFNPVALGKSFGLRDLGNIDFYRRLMDRKLPPYLFLPLQLSP